MLNKGSFLAKYNSNGSILWAINLPQAGKLKFNSQGLLCITGTFTGNIALDSFTAGSAGGEDIYVAKITPGGQVTSLKTFGVQAMTGDLV